MTTSVIALILQYGIQYGPGVIQSIVRLFETPAGTLPTAKQWQDLIDATGKTARQQMMESLVRAGIDPNSPQGQAMLVLTPA